MPLSTKCPSCGAPYTISDAFLGKTIRCQKCQAAFQVAGPAGKAAGTPPPRPAAAAARGPAGTASGVKRTPPGPPPAKTAPRPATGRAAPPPLDDDADEVDEAPPPRKKGGAGKVLLILGAVGGVLLLFCCGGVSVIGYWWAYSTANSVKNQLTSDLEKAQKDWDKQVKDNPDFKFDPGDFPGMDPNKKPGDAG